MPEPRIFYDTFEAIKYSAMPDFTYDQKLYYNPVEFALHFIGGTWKMPILWRLNNATMRYSELKKTLPHISHKMLSTQLRELEKNELIIRNVHAVVPPKVEYSISAKGKKTIPVIQAINAYGHAIMKEKGISFKEKGKKKVATKKKN